MDYVRQFCPQIWYCRGVCRLLDDRLTIAIIDLLQVNPMKAITHCEYGGPEVLKVEEIEKPVPNDNQLLVRVRAASVNPLDLTIRGPLLLRPLFGLRKPKDTRLGVDYAGTVEAVGKNVTNFKPGDEVFGGKTGALAEYVCVLADRAVV